MYKPNFISLRRLKKAKKVCNLCNCVFGSECGDCKINHQIVRLNHDLFSVDFKDITMEAFF